MNKTTLALALIAGLSASPALAHQCPQMMAAIDEALATAGLSDADEARVMELRAEGEELHEAGDHNASEEALGEAQEILGIN